MDVIFDLHTQHARCGHATGDLRDYVEAALERGLAAVGLSDHSPFFAEPEDHHKPWAAMAKSEFAAYVAEALRLKEEYRGQIDVLVGVESDFFPSHVELYRDIYRRYPLDYVIGSVHVLGEHDLFHPALWNDRTPERVLALKERYCDLVVQSARSGAFDVLGHIDALKGNYPEVADVSTPAVDRMLRAIAEADVVVEVNTSGRTKPCGGWYPSPELIDRAHFHDVKVTFGSDAHVPERVGEDFETVRAHLKSVGYREWYLFERRVRRSVPL